MYTTVVPDVSAETLMAEIKAKTEKGSKAYAIGRTHINGIEGFWSFTKERFYKYNEFLYG